MATFYVYQLRNKQLVTVGLGTPDDEGTQKITVFDGKIPPNIAKHIGVFKADSECDYIHNMINILLDYAYPDKKTLKLIKKIEEEGL